MQDDNTAWSSNAIGDVGAIFADLDTFVMVTTRGVLWPLDQTDFVKKCDCSGEPGSDPTQHRWCADGGIPNFDQNQCEDSSNIKTMWGFALEGWSVLNPSAMSSASGWQVPSWRVNVNQPMGGTNENKNVRPRYVWFRVSMGRYDLGELYFVLSCSTTSTLVLKCCQMMHCPDLRYM